jgi:uracil-DNA glycosylase
MDKLIFGGGFDSADLMIVGDYARKFDATSGQCLSGYYKSKLDEYLKLSKFSIDNTYRTCIIKHYIKGLGVGTWGQDKKIIESCIEIHELESEEFYIEYLIDEMNTIKPAVIIVLGEYALWRLTGKHGITNWRGSIVPLTLDIQARLTYPMAPAVKVLAAQHPSIVHTQEEQQFLLRMDFRKL